MPRSKSNESSTQVKVAVITAISAILVALITSPWWFEKVFSEQTPPPPAVLIKGFEDEQGDVNIKHNAPFKVYVRVSVAHGQGHYLYLIVDDGNGQWVQPPLGEIGEGTEYTGACYLGRQDGQSSLNKTYRIYAVVTNTPYEEGDQLNLSTVEAKSEVYELFRTH